jgi:hypothetical protein
VVGTVMTVGQNESPRVVWWGPDGEGPGPCGSGRSSG